ncbi:NACHT domain-containing protein [Rhizobium leguminosarum]|nr:NACHT domain-containing protein [Rhizobium leguminosarum]
MTKKSEWASFEDQVRGVAGHIWGRPCKPNRVGGVNLDGVVVLSNEIHVFIEITEDRTLGKVRTDVQKLQTARSSAFIAGVMARCFCVINGPVTTAMKEAGAPHHVNVLSYTEYSKLFFDFDQYSVARSAAPFGSAIHPLTGETDDTKYVPVRYTVDGRRGDISSSDVADFLRQGRDIILLGEYGSGKSRCLREVFRQLTASAEKDFCYPVAIDLRKSWGLRQSGELIRRHFNDLGLDDLEASAIRAFRARSLVMLVDGFDEIGSQAWSNDLGKLRAIRAKSLEGVKDLVKNNGGGTLVAGREHYFATNEEMYSSLGMDARETIIIRSKNEFSDSELLEYFQNRDLDVDIPSWLPRRPLICQTIGELASDDFDAMFGEEGNEIAFWNHFIKVLCQRDANIHISFDTETIFKIFVQLARLTRARASNVGPLSLPDLQTAFEAVTGTAPVEEASILLQRLPSLGRVGQETADLQFVDVYILDGLRAKDVASIAHADEIEFGKVSGQKWLNPLGDLGQRVLANENSLSERTKLNLLARAEAGGNMVLASDVFAALLRENTKAIDFEGIELKGAEFLYLPLDEREFSNFTLRQSYFGELALPAKMNSGARLIDCVTPKVTGISSPAALPNWITDLDAEAFDSVANVAKIRKIGLNPAQEILVTVVRKTFFQKGAGRKEEALLRGLGKVAAKSLSTRILNLMLKEGLLTSFKGDEGPVYSPVRSNTARMQKLLDELGSSTDPLWVQVSVM